MTRFANRNPRWDLPRTLEGGEEQWEVPMEDIPSKLQYKLSREDLTEDEWEHLDTAVRDSVLENSQRSEFSDEEWSALAVEQRKLVIPYAQAANDLGRALDLLVSEINDQDYWERIANQDMESWLENSDDDALRTFAEKMADRLELLDERGDYNAIVDRAIELVRDWGNWGFATLDSGDFNIDWLQSYWEPDTSDVEDAAATLSEADDDDELLNEVFKDELSTLKRTYDLVPFDDISDLTRYRVGMELDCPYAFSFDLERDHIVSTLDEEFPAETWRDYYRHGTRQLGTFRPTLPNNARAFPWLTKLEDGMFEVVELGSYEDLEFESRHLEHCIAVPDNGWPQRFAEEEYDIFSIRPVDAAHVWQAVYTGKQQKKVDWTLPHFTVALARYGYDIEHILGYHNREVGEGPSDSSFRPWEIVLVWDALSIIALKTSGYGNGLLRSRVSLRHGWESVVEHLQNIIAAGGGGALATEQDLEDGVREFRVPDSFAANTVAAFETLEPLVQIPELEELEELRERGIINPADDEGSCPHCGGPRKGFCLPPGAARKRSP
jgi:hypothetical protein